MNELDQWNQSKYKIHFFFNLFLDIFKSNQFISSSDMVLHKEEDVSAWNSEGLDSLHSMSKCLCLTPQSPPPPTLSLLRVDWCTQQMGSSYLLAELIFPHCISSKKKKSELMAFPFQPLFAYLIKYPTDIIGR